METMGQIFRAARERKRINVSRAAALTRIKIQHIESMEADDFSKMPAPIYAKGFIRNYADFLGLDPAPLIQEYLDVHLNPGEKASRPRKTEAEAAEPVSRPAPAGGLPRRLDLKPVIAWLRGLPAKTLPFLPRLAAVGVLVLVLAGIARCAADRGSESGTSPAEAGLDPQAIMKEPPLRYLELPGGEETGP